MENLDLFGQKVIKDILLRDKYIEPPFTRLDAVSGTWQKRKTMWKNKGIKSELGREGALCLAQGLNKFDPRESYTGTSIFDPVLCELMDRWFCPENGLILDPFAGGSVRGIVANKLGLKTGFCICLHKDPIVDLINKKYNTNFNDIALSLGIGYERSDTAHNVIVRPDGQTEIKSVYRIRQSTKCTMRNLEGRRPWWVYIQKQIP
jgi:DNA modification methylase